MLGGGRADLHTHSRRSDGVLEPADLVRQARDAGLACIALADHDSLAGLEEAAVEGEHIGVRVIAAVELSVRDADERGMDDHLLGFFVSPTAPALLVYLEGLQDARVQMARQTVEILAKLGMPVRWERVLELAEGAVVTRPHIARALVEAGYVPDERAAFDRYLGSGKPAAPERPSPTPEHAIATVIQAGGVAALAHPVFPHDPDWQDRLAALPLRLERMQTAGLRAVECYYPDATPEVAEAVLALTRERGLVPTGGSDFHGPGKAPFVPLGHTTVGMETVETLEAFAVRA